nr:low molecular weight protein-tyrosine-phosphatase [uncultured Roseateles sp.]
MPAVLLVCTANLCRSPLAELLMKTRLPGFGPGAAQAFSVIESAGVRAAPRPGPIDARAAAAAQRAGLSPNKKWRSRRVVAADFERFDLILAMDSENLRELKLLCPAALHSRLHLLLDFAPGLQGQEVPDPYFGPAQGFDHVIGLLSQAVQGLGQAWREGRLPVAAPSPSRIGA